MAANDSNPKRLAHQAGSYDSEFEFDSEAERKRRKYEDLAKKERKKRSKKDTRESWKRNITSKGSSDNLVFIDSLEEGRIMRHKIVSLNAFDRHKLLVNNYLMYYGGQKTEFQRDRSKDKTDMDVIRQNHKFLWTEDDDPDETWAKRLAKKYYDKLFKEYCISDLSRYKENKVAMRWRIEKEVVQGKGQFICGNKKCSECEGLRSWEVNFAYLEDGQKKNALVKLRLCPDCSYKLNYHHRKKEVKQPNKRYRDEEKELKQRSSKDSDESQMRDHESQCQKETQIEGHQDTEPSGSSGAAAENIWSGPAKIVEEKSREEEFDEYFADMFL